MEAIALEQAGKLALQGSGWAVAILLGILLIIRDKQYGECLKAQITLATQMATALERSSTTNAAVAASLDSRTGVFERLSDRVGQLAQEVDGSSKAIADRVSDNGRVLNDVAKAVNDMRLEARGRP